MQSGTIVALANLLFAASVGAGAQNSAPAAKVHSREVAAMEAELGFAPGFDEPPRPERMTKPDYPRSAFDACIEGTVVVVIGIDAKGSVCAAKVVESIEGLDEAALGNVKRWRFKPAKRSGVAVGTVALAPVSFKIFDDKDRGMVKCEPKAAPGH